MTEVLKDVAGDGSLQDIVAYYRVTLVQLGGTITSAVPAAQYGLARYG